MDQVLASLAWCVPRLSPYHTAVLPLLYPYDDLAYPLLCLWSPRPPCVRVRVAAGEGGSAPGPDPKLRKRKGSSTPVSTPPAVAAASGSNGSVTAGRITVDLPAIHHGSPCTWYGTVLHHSFQRMFKAVHSEASALFGPLVSLAPSEGVAAPGSDLEVIPSELVAATVSACVPTLAADARKYCRLVPSAAVSHFAAGVVAAIVAPALFVV